MAAAAMDTDSPRVISHLDMDAFYASVELLRYPELRGQPVVIGGGHPAEEITLAMAEPGVQRFARLRDYVGRGVITTATYEARAFGLHSGMGLMKAAQLAPNAVRLPTDFEAYRRYSRLFKVAVRAIVPHIEDNGIDEMYLDLTDLVAPEAAAGAKETPNDAWEGAREVAQAIKDAVRRATGLSCSIGVAPNKLLAKIASDLDKPDGLTILTVHDLAVRVWPLPTRRINGIGPKTSAKLEAAGVRTIGDLAAAQLPWLIEQFGRNCGSWLHDAAHGRDERPVVTHSEPKSISRETTFERDLHATRDREQLSQIFTELCMGVSQDLQRKGCAGKTIGLKLRYDNFKTVTRDQTIAVPTQDPLVIRRAAGQCLKRVPLDRRIRLLGVRVGALCPVQATGPPPQPVATEPAPSLF